MYDIHQISDKPILLEPPQEPQPNQWISRIAEVLSVVTSIGLFGYLIISLVFGGQAATCNYSGDIPINAAFATVYAEHCTTIGAPVSRSGQANIAGSELQLVQYFEGALLTADLSGDPQTAKAFPLGSEFAPDEITNAPAADQAAFEQFWAANGRSDLLGQPITDLIQMDEYQVIFFENGGLRWDTTSQQVSPHALGRMHLYSNNPSLMVKAATIPEERFRGAIGSVPEYDIDIHVQHPILFEGDQQLVTVRVLNTLEDSPVSDLSLNGTVHFADVGESINQPFVLTATEEPGVYSAVITLPDHPDGNAGRDVLVNVSSTSNGLISLNSVKKFQTWW